MFTPDELKTLEDATTHSIDISQFVPLESVDPVISTAPIILHLTRRSQAYSLLTTALRKKKHVLWDVGFRVQGAHCGDPPPGQGSGYASLHFQAEVREIKELGLEPATVSESELKLAEQLIDHLSAKRFDPNEFKDEFKDRIEAAVQRKSQARKYHWLRRPWALAKAT